VDFITPDVRDRLMQEHGEFKQLMETHREADERLADLRGKRALTSKEEVEEKELKRTKLHAKERIYKIVQDFNKAKSQ
jgi:uncharacterized protein YdcH (DUF465 family)